MESTPSYARIQTFCLAVIAAAVMIYMVFWLRPVLVPFVVALFVVSGITPILEGLEKRLGVNRVIAAGITFLLGLVVMGALGLCIWLSVLQMAEKGTAYRERVRDLVTKAQVELDGLLNRSPFGSKTDAENPEDMALVESDGPAGTIPAGAIPAGAIPVGTSDSGSGTDDRMDKMREAIDSSLRTILSQLSSELFALVTTSIVVLIYVFFLLLGSVGASKTSDSFSQIDNQVRSYLSLKTTISIITGGIFGMTLWLFGVPMALTFGLLTFLLNFIPNVGPIVATLLPLPFIILSPDGSLEWMLSAIAAIAVIQVISGNVVEPKIMGSSSDLHPVVILLALMFWGMMWGITGMFLATPITAGLKIVFERFDSTKPIAAVLAGRWDAVMPKTTSTV
ncbi:AI-2 transport protein TqsA [Polystyrenella longa]|uniref:AI-2 transport protein TqsA n=1 Tax=Polystyrenella longa TaxID=2528007 RepID=A0A518CGZ4_9PLAN|nr:AI-2E family transporter [Polystyrenella longa]QDU78499.1 AI-2 transport protein TqsA [Polystyrenella longa]